MAKPPRFQLEDLHDVELDLGREIALAECLSPTKGPGVVAIGNDPKLLDTVYLFMGRVPKQIEFRLMVSLVRSVSTLERLSQQQTVLFHYDLDDFESVFFNFYLTHCDADTGAHVLIPGSHRAKKMKHLLRTTNHTDEELSRTYLTDRPVIVSGPAGFGFAENTFCFHKALAPFSSDRYMLQIRYT